MSLSWESMFPSEKVLQFENQKYHVSLFTSQLKGSGGDKESEELNPIYNKQETTGKGPRFILKNSNISKVVRNMAVKILV